MVSPHSGVATSRKRHPDDPCKNMDGYRKIWSTTTTMGNDANSMARQGGKRLNIHEKNKRAINLSDPALKGYLNWIQAELKEYKRDKWQPCTYGGVPGKSAPIAVNIVTEVMARAKKGKNTLRNVHARRNKSLRQPKRNKVLKATKKQLAGIPEIALRLKTRHKRTIYATKVGPE